MAHLALNYKRFVTSLCLFPSQICLLGLVVSDNSTIGDPSIAEDASEINNAGNNVAASALDQVKTISSLLFAAHLDGGRFTSAPLTCVIDLLRNRFGGNFLRFRRIGNSENRGHDSHKNGEKGRETARLE